MYWGKKSKTLSIFILGLLVISSCCLETSSGEEDSKIVAIDNIVGQERIGSMNVFSAVYIEDDTVFYGIDILHEGYRYVKYDLSTYESEIILEGKKGVPIGDPLSAIYTGEDILIFGGQLAGQSKDTNKIFQFDLENDKLSELDVKVPVDPTPSEPFYQLCAVWAEDEAYLFMESGIYTFDPSDNSMEKHNASYPEDFFIGATDRATIYVNGSIYMVSYDKIYRYNIKIQKLEMVRELPTKHPDIRRRSAVYTGEYIYIIGGGELGRDPTVTDEIIRYDPESEEAELLDTKLPRPMHACNLVHYEGFIYIIGHFIEFSPSSKHLQSTNKIYRYNYQGIDADNDYPGIENEGLNWKLMSVLVGVGVIASLGIVIFHRKYR